MNYKVKTKHKVDKNNKNTDEEISRKIVNFGSNQGMNKISF